MKIFLPSIKLRAVLFFLIIAGFANSTYAQTTGDYQTVASGNWTTLATWQRWNGTAWAPPIAVVTEGYPGQYNNVQRAYISNGHNITVDANIGYQSNFTRLEFLTSVSTSNTSLTFAPNVALSINGAVVTEESAGNNTISVGSGFLTCQQMRLTNLLGTTDVSEINVTTGSVTLTNSGGNLQLQGATSAKSIFRFTDSGFLSLKGSITGLGGLIAGTGVVTFDNVGGQNLNGLVYHNVVLAGSGIKIFDPATTITRSLTFLGSVVANLPATVYTIPSLVFGTTGQIANTYGGQNYSTALIKTSSYFDANITTGNITVPTNLPFVKPTIGAYTYTGLSQGPSAATNSGTGTIHTFSYINNGGMAYGPTSTPPTNAGNYFVTTTVLANGVWLANSSAATGFSILPRNLTIIANNATKLFGDTHTTGAGSIFFTSTGLQNGETIGTVTIISIGAPSGAPVDSHPIVPSAAGGGTFSAANYTIGYINGTLTVANPNFGDYRTKASGVWTDVTTWERYNGTSWVEPLASTSPQGYPCQYGPPPTVYIRDTHGITSGAVFVSDANRAGRIEFSAGSGSSSLTIAGTSILGASGGIRIIPSSLAGVTRTINVGAGRLNAGNIFIEDTGNDGIDSEIIIGTGTLYVSNGNVAMAGSSVRNAIRFSGIGILQLDGNSGAISGGTIVAGTGRVTFSDFNAQTVGAYAFNNLTLTDAGTKTINAFATIAGNLTISGSATASLNTGTTYNVNSLILGTNGRAQGTWGSTTSAATITNNTYFAATTGMLNVALSTPDVTPIIGSYVYAGLPQGPNNAANTGIGSSYTFTYQNSGGTSYGPSVSPPTNVGNYTVIATVEAVLGLSVSRSSPATAFSISQRALTITASNGSKIYGSTYTTGAGSTAFTSSGLQISETIGSITIASTGSTSAAAIGTYSIVPSTALGGTFTASNYLITYSNGTLTVNPNIGDYRTKASGDWNVMATWERWNGTAWAEPLATTPQGYPGQFSALSTVYIENAHNINCNRTLLGANRLGELIFSEGPSDSSFSIIGGNSIQVNFQVIVRSGGNRNINVGAGFLSVGGFNFSDTGNDSVDSKLTVSSGAVYVFGSVIMSGSSARNTIEFIGNGGELFVTNGTITGGTLIPASGTVIYNRMGNQTVGTYGYTNLSLQGSGIKTVTATTTISSNLTIDQSATASLNTGTTYIVGTLTLGCRDSEDGTWGSSTSAAFYPDDIYFEQTTGLVDVTADTSMKTPVTTEGQLTCTAPTNAIITVTPQYGGETYSFDNGVTYQASNIKSGLAAGIYIIIIMNSKGCFSPTATVTINSATKTWNGSMINTDWNNPVNWTPNGVPTADNCVVIPSNVFVNGANYAGLGHNLTITSTGNLNVNSTNSLKITDFVNVNIGGSLTFEDTSSLIQTNNVTNIGNITYKRNIKGGELDYTYWSAPVAGQNLLAVSPLTKLDKFFSFDAVVNDWVQEVPSATTMSIGKGYIIRGIPLASLPPPGFHYASFIGVPNNGNKTIAVVGGQKSNLIGNPYPSAIYADQFLFDNQAFIDGTIYFWTHNTAIQDRNQITGVDGFGTPKAGSGAFAYTSDDYASYSLTGGVGTSGNINIDLTENVSNRPTGKIAAGQSFFTTSTSGGGIVTFTNSMRVDGLGNVLNNSNFYKIKNPKLKTGIAIEKHRIWLNLTNKQGAFKQTLVGYITNATNTWDSLYDGESYDGNDFIDFYSINQNKNLVIQGRAIPFDDNDEVHLGYRTTISGEFIINIEQVDGLLTNQAVFIEDKLTNSITDLKAKKYTFSTKEGTFNDRFVLRFKDKTLGINDLVTQSNQVLVSIKNKQIIINSFTEIINNVTIYDLLGKQIHQKDKVNSSELILSNFVTSHQTLIVKTALQNGKTDSQKIIY